MATQGDVAGAAEQFRLAWQASPDDAGVLANLGYELIRLGDVDAGLPHLVGALQRDPTAGAQFSRAAQFCMQRGRVAAAVRIVKTGLAKAPDDVPMLVMLAAIRSECPDEAFKDVAEGVRLALRACAITKWEDPLALNVAATAYYAAGQLEQAIETSRQALQVANRLGQQSLADQIAGRLRWYQSRAGTGGGGAD